MTSNKREPDKNSKKLTLCIHIKNNLHHFSLLVLLLIGIAIIYTSSSLSHNLINNEKNAVFENTWQYSLNNKDFSEVILPHSENTSEVAQITLKNKLPNKMISGATILLRTSQQDIQVIVGNENIYSTVDIENKIIAPSAAYHFVRMPTNCAGKEINIVLSSPYKNYSGFMNQIFIGSKASNIFFLLHENGFRFVIGFLIFSLGVLLMIMFLFAKSNKNNMSIIYLGAFFTCAGYWVIVESKMAQFIFPYPVALTNTSIFALSLLPVFSGLYYYSTHTKLFKKVGKYIIFIVSSASFLFSVAMCVNPVLPLQILPLYIAFMGLYVILVFVSILVESIKTGNFFSTTVSGIIAFSICCFMELVFYLINLKGYNESNFFTFGLLLFCIAMVTDAVQNFAHVHKTAIKVDVLSVLAYKDSLTGLKNRTAFLESVSKIDVDTNTFVSLAMFDINNLKVVNDTLGHMVGDAMLLHSSKAIKNSLRREDVLYRIGGDEFAAIIIHDNELDFLELENRILNIIENENKKKLSYFLSIAYGYATFSKHTDKTLFETLSRADKAMYSCKKIQKSK